MWKSLAANTSDRYELIRQVVVEHLKAEDDRDIEREMATYADDAVFENVARNITITGKEKIRKYYLEKDASFPDMKFQVLRLMIDERGAFTELQAKWSVTQEKQHEPRQMRMVAYFEIDKNGKITKESTFMDFLTAIGLRDKFKP